MIRSLVISLTLERDRRKIGLQRKQPTRRLKREKRAGSARERLRRGNTSDGHVVKFPGAKFKGQRKCKTRYLDTERTALAPFSTLRYRTRETRASISSCMFGRSAGYAYWWLLTFYMLSATSSCVSDGRFTGETSRGCVGWVHEFPTNLSRQLHSEFV